MRQHPFQRRPFVGWRTGINPGRAGASFNVGTAPLPREPKGDVMNRLRRRMVAGSLCLFAAAVALDATGCASAEPMSSWTSGGVAAVEIVDRASGEHLGVHANAGARYVVGMPGHEYRLRIRNLTGARVLAVTSVDGVNVVSGETASPSQSGYVLDPWQVLEIDGWRTSLAQTAAFYFTDLGSSYAARTGRPNDVGVIGVAVFRERMRVMDQLSRDMPARAESAPASAPASDARADRSASEGGLAPLQKSAKPAASLGTGYGREETSYARHVEFERATAQPAELLAVRYDSRDNLVAMGVLPRPYPRVIGRAPDPFPGTFVAPPPRN
jgi:hypothetical protein